jgi:ribonuclease HI
LDFASVKKKFPHQKDDIIRDVLLEASQFFDKKKTITSKAVTPKGAAPKGAGSFTIYVDGASKGNPGISAAGVMIKDADGNNAALIKKYLGVMTNNMAEYNALIIGLKGALKLNGRKVNIFMDSELVVKQIKGEYRVKNEKLKLLYDTAVNLLKKFDKYGIKHIERSKNSIADSLANEAIKKHLSSE